MILDYAKTRSDATVQREGGNDELETHKRRRLAEKGMLDISHLPQIELRSNLFHQSASKPTRPSKNRRTSSVLLPPAKLHARPRLPKALASSLLLVPQLLSFPTSTYRQTRSCSYGICPTTQPKRVFPPSLAASRDSRKSEWCLAARGLHSSSTMPRLEQSAQRRLRRVCPWASKARPFALPISDSSRGWLHPTKYPGSCSFWRLEGLVSNMC